MRVGLDFDNTIACYDDVFVQAARARGLLNDHAATSKAAVRAHIRQLDDGEKKWMALQGEVYGKRMPEAEMISGVDAFMRACRSRNVPINIISHKTIHGHFDPERINLRVAARAWMESRGFFAANGYGLKQDDVIFEHSREEKVAQISKLGCTHFVDDLEEVLLEPTFPENVHRILYDPIGATKPSDNFSVAHTWEDIQELVFAN